MLLKKLVRAAAPAFLMCGAVLATPGCGDDDGASDSDVQALCRKIADTFCDQFFECLSAEERGFLGLPDSLSACKSQMREEQGCEAASADDACEGNETFKRANAEKCINQFSKASCSQVRSGDFEDYAPACEEVCVVE